MKKIVLGLIGFFAFAIAGNAQCNKNLQLSSSKTSYLNGKMEVQNTKDESVVVDITKNTITLTPNGNSQEAMSGKIKEINCGWKVPYKDGKIVIKSDLIDPSGDSKDATITIEAKNGKITLLAEVMERPDQKIRLEVDKMEEKG